MNKIVYAVRPSNKTFSTRCTKALRDKLGGSVQLHTTAVPEGTTLFITWGFRKTVALASAIAQKIPFVILDRGYFEPSRVDRVSISFNGHHGLSMPLDVLDLPPRWHPPIQEWQWTGERIYVMGQVANDASLRGMPIAPWMHRAACESLDTFGRAVVKRPHPKALNSWERKTCPPLDSLYEEMFACVTYSSTVAVQTTLQGIPTIAMHPASPAYKVCTHSMRLEAVPGRQAWAHTLSHREYDLCDSRDACAAAEYIILGYGKAAHEAQAGAYDTEGLR